MQMNAQRYPFANQLRGIAAILVLISHYGFFYWVRPDYVQVLAHLPTDYLANAGYFVAQITQLNNSMRMLGIDLGVIGVALFFLISGFVITLSFQHYQPTQFLVARLFRIYPTYWVSLFLLCVAVYGYAKVSYPIGGILSNALLLHDWLGDSTLDDVNWSLLIEIKFYLLIALAVAVRQLHTRFLIIFISLSCFGLLLISVYYQTILLSYPNLRQIIDTCTYSSLFLLYMQIGVRYANYRQNIMSGRVLWLDIGLISILFVSCCVTQVIFNSKIILISYTLATIIFFSFAHTSIQQWSGWNNRLLQFFTKISYPLYLLHAVIGYILLTLFLQHQVAPVYSILLTTGFIILLSWLLHYVVEKPSQILGKNLAVNYKSSK